MPKDPLDVLGGSLAQYVGERAPSHPSGVDEIAKRKLQKLASGVTDFLDSLNF